MADEPVKSVLPEGAVNSQANALSAALDAFMEGISTAIPVRVDEVEPGGTGNTGYVSVTPLVCSRDAWNNILEPRTIHHLPYSRIQGGVAALVIDPVPGDIGIAIFAKRDISTLAAGQKEPVQPGSYRKFNEADGMYIGGILNTAPEIWLELDQSGNATLNAPRSVTVRTKDYRVECETYQVRASVSAGLYSPSWGFYDFGGGSGGAGTFYGNVRHIGNYDQQGSYTSTGDQVAGGISQMHHIHGGVYSGNSTTSEPR